MSPTLSSKLHLPTLGGRNLIFAMLLLLLLAGYTVAQDVSGATPLGVAPGAPAGSYALSGFDNVNLFNGNLNFNLPLVQVGGRGGAQVPLLLPIEQKWLVKRWIIDANNNYVEYADPNWWNDSLPIQRYGLGFLYVRYAGEGATTGCDTGDGSIFFTHTLTRLTFVAPDGTEYELRDQLTNGQWRNVTPTCPSSSQGVSRGQVFVTADGTAATFISDETIYDYNIADPWSSSFVSGYLLLRDGTRYRIDNGQIMWLRDRNGNKVSFAYEQDTGNLTITDSLNRHITVEYGVTDVAPYGLCDRITLSGFGGTERKIRISKKNLGQVLRAGYTLQTGAQLFPELNGSYVTSYDTEKVSAVWLPNGLSYNFFYNPYGELARVELPTGGAVEYDYAAGVTNWTNSGIIYGSVYRRVMERRIYHEGNALESRQTFSRPESSSTSPPYLNLQNLGYVTVDQYNAAGALLTRTNHYFYGSSAPSLLLGPIGYPAWNVGREYKTEAYAANGTTLLRKVENTWQQGVITSTWNTNIPNNPRIAATTTTLADSNQVTKQTFAYDDSVPFNNQSDVYEYDYGTGAPPTYAVRHTHTDYLKTNPANGIDYTAYTGAHLRGLPTAQQVYAVNQTNGAESVVSATYTGYDQVGLSDCPGIIGHDAAFATTYTARGNVTHVTSYADAAQLTGAVDTWLAYDIAGNLIQRTDPRGKASWVSYNDNFADGVGRNTYAFPTTTTSAVPDPDGFRATDTPLTTTTVYDYWTGHVTATTDANGQITTADYSNEPLDRLKQVNRPDGGRTTYTYVDAHVCGPYVETRTLIDASGRQTDSWQFFDGLGRAYLTETYDGRDANNPYRRVDRQYDALGRVWRVSNPYRSPGCTSAVNPSNNWTTTAYDALSRAIAVTTPDNAVVSTAYSGNTVTVTDQAGKVRRSVADGLGRLSRVDEPDGNNNLGPVSAPVQPTTYAYDALGNLREVMQGSQHRYFMYDSLARLIRAKNPEQLVNASLTTSADPVSGNTQWSMAYAYDANSNLESKTDAQGVTTSYLYDNINRVKQTTYSTGIFTLNTYDFATNGRGRFYADYESSEAGTINYVLAYDATGRPTQRQTQFHVSGPTWASYNSTREYDKAGHVTHETYPSGHAVDYRYDAAGRLGDDGVGYAFSGNLGDGVTRAYAWNVQYNAASQMTGEQYGTQTPLYHTLGYNVRGQLYLVQLGTGSFGNWNRGMLANAYGHDDLYTQWGLSGTDNNGNVLRTHHYVPADELISSYQLYFQDYEYDELNRLKKATETTFDSQTVWQQQYAQAYSYDRWGNRTINQAQTWGSGINNTPFTVDTATNRLTPGGAGTISYDAVGNQTYDNYSTGTAAVRRLYDAENRLTETQTASPSPQTVSKYTYDATGKRMRRETGGVVTWQVYGFDGELVAEYAAQAAPTAPQKEYGYRNGELLIVAQAAAGANNTAAFKGSDTTTQGSWQGRYGADGYALANETTSYPAYAQVSLSGQANHTWAGATTDARALQKAAGTDRIAATWYSGTAFTIDINLTDGQAHQVALYCLDWDGNNGRAERIDVLDAASGAVIDSQTVATFSSGRYLSWQVRGHVQFRVTCTGGWNAVVSGLFFGERNLAFNQPATQSSTGWGGVASRAVDGNTSGAWDDGSIAHTDYNAQAWWQVDLGSVQPLSRVDYWLMTECCSSHGDFDIKVSADGNSWTSYYVAGPVDNGSVAVSGSGRYMRVQLRGTYYLALAEVRVYGDSSTGSGTSGVQWLVADQLGTPRMVVDQTGSLASVKRHDYLPFGEEVSAGIGGRTTGQGYTADNVRQKFAASEHDSESGLDFMQARYSAGVQGRFTSVDPLMASAHGTSPQTWNRYSYALNNPLRYSDPSGLGPGTTQDIARGKAVGNPHTSEEEIHRQYVLQAEAARAAGQEWLDATLRGNAAGAAGVSLSTESNGEPQDSQNQNAWSDNATMVIIWEVDQPWSPAGHVSYITMQDDISYSWEGIANWTRDKPSLTYTDKRSKSSAATGYILDFGSTLNARFQYALIHAYDSPTHPGRRVYDPVFDNCGQAFNIAITAIRKNIGAPKTHNVFPSSIKEYIEKNLEKYIRAGKQFPKH